MILLVNKHGYEHYTEAYLKKGYEIIVSLSILYLIQITDAV